MDNSLHIDKILSEIKKLEVGIIFVRPDYTSLIDACKNYLLAEGYSVTKAGLKHIDVKNIDDIIT